MSAFFPRAKPHIAHSALPWGQIACCPQPVWSTVGEARLRVMETTLSRGDYLRYVFLMADAGGRQFPRFLAAPA